MILTFVIIGVTLILFVMDRLPIDVVGLMALLAFMLTGILDPTEALAGFSAPIVLVLAGLFVVGEALSRTGVAERFGEKILSISGSKERNLLCACMLASAGLSSFMSSTGAVAMLMPVVTQLARRLNIPPSRLLMPLAFAALFGGMLTLIGTPPNLVVNSELVRAGATPFGFFSFTGPGIILLICGISFVLVASPRLLNSKSKSSHPWENVNQEGKSGLTATDLAKNYGLPGNIFRMGARPTSKLTGKTVAEIGIRKKYRVTLLEIRPWDDPDKSADDGVQPETVVPMKAILMAHGSAEDVARFAKEEGLDILP
ncbi:MAG: SLC13 family permease, partial [Planctomycetota bacterium]|nr:SLC13 family permease [Planctomycetota bacterium]